MKKIVTLIICVTLVTMVFADEQLKIFQRTFYRGNLQDKVRVINAAAVVVTDTQKKSDNKTENSLSPIFVEGLIFVNTYGELLKDEPQMISLAATAAKNAIYGNSDEVLPLLISMFSLYTDSSVSIPILDSIGILGKGNTEAIKLINSYGLELIQNETINETLLTTVISTLQSLNDSSSFSVLFDIAASDKIPAVARTATELALISTEENITQNAISIIENKPINQKRLALRLVLNNQKNSDFSRAEVAEKALNIAISNVGNDKQEEFIQLQLEALSELRRVQWTRSSDLIVKVFNKALQQFNDDDISEKDFIEVINSFVELASSKAGSSLSDYLGFLNNQKEQNLSCNESIVLAVINALGLLGDKTAFDNLLYVGYLNYPESVIEASLVALGRLKF